MFGKDIPTIKPAYTTDMQHPVPTIAHEQADRTAQPHRIKVWQIRVDNEEALNQLMRFVGTHDGVTDLKPRYRYNAEKQKEYRARKKARDEGLKSLQDLPSHEERVPSDV